MSGARSLPVAGFALMLVVGSTACGGGSAPDGAKGAFVISIGIGEPKHLIPSSTAETEGHAVLDALFTPLVSYDA